MSKQLVRSGTAIGALLREAGITQSKKDFVKKMSITLMESNETSSWIDLLKDTEYIKKEHHKTLVSDCMEIIAMLVSSVKNTKSRK